ncbi:MAG TPA: hypothetical protein PLK77_03315 [Pyrinomonadaceae bacterium]|nr:hypothetical protein [Pyrinomonadaceae bacterium]
MDITVTVSDEIAKVILRKAGEQDMGLAALASDLLEEKVKEEFSEHDVSRGRRNLWKMSGMFSSGATDTSERMHEILYGEDLDPAQGFGTDELKK